MAVTPNTRLLGLTGRAGSGRHTIAEMLEAEGGWASITIASATRDLIRVLNPTIVDDNILGGFDDYQNIMDRYPDPRQAEADHPEIARIHAAARRTGALHYQLRSSLHSALSYLSDRIVIPDIQDEHDWRGASSLFAPEEAVLGRVIRPSGSRKPPAGEPAGDFVILNAGDLENLKMTVREIQMSTGSAGLNTSSPLAASVPEKKSW